MGINFLKRIQSIPQSVKLAILIFVAAKILVFAIGFFTVYLNTGLAPSITAIFNRWDAPHYVDIAKNWYVSDPTLDAYNFIAFFPLYPILIRLFTVDLNYINLSALIASNVCSIIAFLYLYKLAKLEFNEGIAVKAVLFLSIFPTAYFLSAPYTEGLFFALAIASLYYARLGKWGFAGSLSLFASLTRINGVILLPVLLIEYYHQKGWKLKKTDLNLLWAFLALAGFLIYLGINMQVTGDPFTFMDIQATHWYNRLDPWAGLTNAYNWAVGASYSNNITIGIAPIAFASFGALMVGISVWKRLRPVYIAYMFLSWALAVSTSWWISVPRYVMAMFPMFILLGLLSKKKAVTLTIIGVSGALLCYFTTIFAMGWWAF
ncbi:MAG: glycosyltransferase family 39 protein [Candidatus Bathyarchaeota archaeon]|nr:glycosyltransferase family 39 protein [Candidatus Termiticorpusculum sp.]